MAAIAPWLQATDVLGAMSRGAGLGLQARAQDTQEEEAGDRLRLAYTQLASQEKRAAEQAKAMQDYRLAQLDLKTQQQAMLQDFREKNMARQIEASRESMDLRQKLAENTVKHQADLLALQKDKVATQLSPAVKAQQHVIDAKRRSLQAKLNNPTLFQNEVDLTKQFLKASGQKYDVDEDKLKSIVEDNLSSSIQGLDQQYENLGEGTGLTPSAPQSKTGIKVLSISPAQ